jgi:hypothetical protein
MIPAFPKPHPYPFPRPKFDRLPERRAVTTVAGFRCYDGLVLCADTEHTAGLSKFQRRKILGYMDDECVIRIAGSGHSDYIDMTIEKMLFAMHGAGKNLKGIKDSFEAVALDVHNKHIRPFFDMHDETRPRIYLLAIIRFSSGQLEILKIADTTVSLVEDYEVLGAGEHLARSLIDWLYDPKISTRMMRVFAINIVQQTKRYVCGVGGTTHVVSLAHEPQRRDASIFYDDSEFFFGIQKYLKPMLIACLDEDVADNIFEGCKSALVELFSDVRAATKQKKDAEDRLFKRSTAQMSEPEP